MRSRLRLCVYSLLIDRRERPLMDVLAYVATRVDPAKAVRAFTRIALHNGWEADTSIDDQIQKGTRRVVMSTLSQMKASGYIEYQRRGPFCQGAIPVKLTDKGMDQILTQGKGSITKAVCKELFTSIQRGKLQMSIDILQSQGLSTSNGVASDPKKHNKKQYEIPDTLTKVYKGVGYIVHKKSFGFEFNGLNYDSLSSVAEAITGQSSSGPQFFKLQRKDP